MEYNEEDFLQLSGLQHFCFCRRQWAIIHIENQWAENLKTTEGEILHERVHDETQKESRGEILVTRNLRVYSAGLGVSGNCDAVEFHRDDNGITIAGREGLYIPYPIEYKRGLPRNDNANELQLCAQAMCLEEMLCCDIKEGALYFGESRKRKKVVFTEDLRQNVKSALLEMHQLYKRKYTPKVKISKSCNACSLKDICIPKLMKNRSAKQYLINHSGD